MSAKQPNRVVSERVLKRYDAMLRAREARMDAENPQKPMPVMVRPRPDAKMIGLFRKA